MCERERKRWIERDREREEGREKERKVFYSIWCSFHNQLGEFNNKIDNEYWKLEIFG